jgi:UDP-glucose 4-epimerase
MTRKQVILITGVAGYWGSRVARRLAAEADRHIIGLDREPPTPNIQGLDFIGADIRNPLLADLFQAEGVDTVCHLAFVETIQPSESAFALNVLGTTNLLDACADSGVRKVVLRSSTAVYGARPSNSAFLTEEQALRGSNHYGSIRDLLEIEKFCDGFRHRAPRLILTTLRFASIVGPTVDTPMTRFLRDPWAPGLLGFDPRMQIIHEDDVVEGLLHAVSNDTPGVFNVAATDVLPLNKMRGLAGKPPLSILHPLAYRGKGRFGGVGRGTGRALPIEPDYLRYPWVADLRRMHEVLNFEPRYSAEETLLEFAERRDGDPYPEGSISMVHEEERLRHVIEQRQRARQQQTTTTSGMEEGQEDG